MKPVPLFLFSLPRSGSTLLQRILGAHPEIATVSEPWILLPLVYTMKNSGVCAEYNSDLLSKAITDVIQALPNGQTDYDNAIRLFAGSIYARLCQRSEKYFLDKTPRYYLIIDEIARIFPDAKFIFLFRHPLAVVSSILETYNKGKIGTYWNRIDIFEGPRLLAQGFRSFQQTYLVVQYEDLIVDAQKCIQGICDYLAIPYSDSLLEAFKQVRLRGQLGDDTGTKAYRSMAEAPLSKWKQTINSDFRKKYTLRYLDYLGAETLAAMGYHLDELKAEVRNLKTSNGSRMKDYYSIALACLYSVFEIPLMKKNIKRLLTEKHKLYIHY